MKSAALILFCAFCIPSFSQEVTVAAASDLHSALDEISVHFQQQSSARLKISYGSSGNFYQQIQNGAPFDIFFSANTDYPKKLEAAGLTVPNTYYEYARGKIVLLVRASSRLDLSQGLQVLLDPQIVKVAIADPSHAPYGQAAVAALKSRNLYEKVSAKLVTGENISQAASFVLSGAADIGIIAKSLAVSASAHAETRFAEVPENTYPPIQQASVVLKSSKQQKLAREFEAYIQSPEARKILQQFGFEVPAADTAKSVQ